MSKLVRILVASLALGLSLGAGSARAQDEAGLRLVPAPVDRLDDASLQRGARDFVNYCLTCHTAKYMRYNRLEDIGLTPEEITDNLMFASQKIGDQMTVAMTAEDAAKWFPAPPPDLIPQFGLSMEAARALGWPVLAAPGFEADDVLATLARQGRDQGLDVILVTSDKDLYQLVGDGVVVHNCIDELDKMNPQDRSAIHEALEAVQHEADVGALSGKVTDDEGLRRGRRAWDPGSAPGTPHRCPPRSGADAFRPGTNPGG
mgnify:CR=1 FL=1